MKVLLFLLPLLSFASTQDCLDQIVEAPQKLSQTCLYKDLNHHVLNDGIIQFTPNYALWTDGADKLRWIFIPEGAKINNDDQDNWIYQREQLV